MELRIGGVVRALMPNAQPIEFFCCHVTPLRTPWDQR